MQNVRNRPYRDVMTDSDYWQPPLAGTEAEWEPTRPVG